MLDAIHAQVVHLGVGERIAVARLIDARPELLGPDHRDELRAALASLLSRRRSEWDRIAVLFDERVPRPDREDPRTRDTLRRLASLIVGLFLALSSATVVFLMLSTEPEPEPEIILVPDAAPVDANLADTGVPDADTRRVEITQQTMTAARTVEVDEMQPPRRDTDGWDWVAALMACLLVALGIRWRLLPAVARDHDKEKRKEKAEKQRQQLDDELLEVPVLAQPRASAHLPCEMSAVVESAGLLNQLHETTPGTELDVDATADAVVRSAGVWTPILESRRRSTGLTVFVDVEQRSDSVWLGTFRRLLEEWKRAGVILHVFEFSYHPRNLTDEATGARYTLEDRAQRYGGTPLLVFSRHLQAWEREGPSAWTQQVSAWPVRAWLDPEPTSLEARPNREDIQWLESSGLVRFSFTPAGLRAMAHYIVSSGQSTARVQNWPAPPRVSERERAEALRRWRFAAGLVPDATWDQVERVRQTFPEIRRCFPERWHVHWLIREVARKDPEAPSRPRSDVTPGSGPCLYISREAEHQWRLENDEAGAQAFEAQVHRLWIDELKKLRTATQLEELRRQERLTRHETWLTLSPDCIDALAGFLEKAVDDEARKDLEDIERYLRLKTRRVPKATQRALGHVQERVDAIALKSLVAGFVGTWLKTTPAATLLGLLLVGVLMWPSIDVVQLWQPPSTSGQVNVPATDQVVVTENVVRKPPDPRIRTANRPAMVPIEPGTFTMGSPRDEKDRESDETQHKVTLTRGFWLAETEVTQDQWRTLMGNNPSGFSEEGKGEHPVEQVNWYEAVAYLNALSKAEGLDACYALKTCKGKAGGEERLECESAQLVGLDCRGYRLPTEAEWEYAARAGTTGPQYGPLDDIAWSWSNSSGKTAAVRQKRPNPWGLYDMMGNVWEWTNDWYAQDFGGQDPNGVTNPMGPLRGERASVRGCGWGSLTAADCRAAGRSDYHPAYRYAIRGFRPARSRLP